VLEQQRDAGVHIQTVGQVYRIANGGWCTELKKGLADVVNRTAGLVHHHIMDSCIQPHRGTSEHNETAGLVYTDTEGAGLYNHTRRAGVHKHTEGWWIQPHRRAVVHNCTKG
jgi:hypothetical protein